MAALRWVGRDRTGVTAVEYALIAGLIALVIITAVGLVGADLSNFFMNLHNDVSAVS
ncbi:MAG TPA: Flp family type IVb pilin [Caulobacteraceae bacterium]